MMRGHFKNCLLAGGSSLHIVVFSSIYPVRQVSALLQLLRLWQWIKNVFVLVPLVLTGLFTDPKAVAQTLLVAALFCVASSAAYVVNDLLGRERNLRHPAKS